MKFPKTEQELTVGGYQFISKGTCKRCAAPMLWYLTPAHKNIPLDPGTFVPHWATCPNANEFRKPKAFKTTK